MAFGDKLKEARKNKGLTQQELAKQIGVAKSTLAGYEKGNREPDVFKIKGLIKALDIDADYLFELDSASMASVQDGVLPLSDKEGEVVTSYRTKPDMQPAVDKLLDIEDPAKKSQQIQELSKERGDTEHALEFCELPLYDMPATAGLGNLLDDAPTFKLVDVEMGDIPHGTNILIKISGDSMEPDYNDGDTVYVHTTLDLRDGDVGIFVVDGDSYLKELVKDGRRSKLRSYNPDYTDMDLANYTYCRPVGRVLGVCKGIRE